MKVSEVVEAAFKLDDDSNEGMDRVEKVISEAGITSIMIEEGLQDADALLALRKYLEVHRVPADSYYFKDDFLYIYFKVNR